jgi:hypothetical protein
MTLEHLEAFAQFSGYCPLELLFDQVPKLLLVGPYLAAGGNLGHMEQL